ncbi:hypothetical protein LTS18_005119, partial [Coniosporium uncinatum]
MSLLRHPFRPTPIPLHHGHAADILDAAERERVNAAEEFELQSLDGAETSYQEEEDLVEARRKEKRREKLARLLEAEEMKFSHSIQFNAVPDWSSHYIAYSNLKKLIYSLEKQLHQKNGTLTNDAESSPLLETSVDDPDKVFTS